MKPSFSKQVLAGAAPAEVGTQHGLPAGHAGQADAQAFASAMREAGSTLAGAGVSVPRWSGSSPLARLDRSSRSIERGLSELARARMSLPETLAFTSKVQDYVLATQLVSKVVGKSTQTIDQLTKLQ